MQVLFSKKVEILMSTYNIDNGKKNRTGSGGRTNGVKL